MFRRRWAVLAVLVLAALAAWRIVPGVIAAARPADYRDPVQLAQAVKGAEHGTAASCAKITAGKYICSVAASDAAVGTYQVTVSADGKSWQES